MLRLRLKLDMGWLLLRRTLRLRGWSGWVVRGSGGRRVRGGRVEGVGWDDWRGGLLHSSRAAFATELFAHGVATHHTQLKDATERRTACEEAAMDYERQQAKASHKRAEIEGSERTAENERQTSECTEQAETERGAGSRSTRDVVRNVRWKSRAASAAAERREKCGSCSRGHSKLGWQKGKSVCSKGCRATQRECAFGLCGELDRVLWTQLSAVQYAARPPRSDHTPLVSRTPHY